MKFIDLDIPSASQILVRVLLIIFITELLLMLLFSYIGLDISPVYEALFDALLLASLSLGPIYFLVILPFKKETASAMTRLMDYKYANDHHSIMAVTDVKGTIVDVNDLFCAISGYSREELVGQNHRLLNSGLYERDFWKSMYQQIGRGQPWRSEIRNRAKDGHFYWVDTTIVPIMNSQHKPEYYVAVRTDITQLKRLKDQVENYSKELEMTVQQRTRDLEFAKEQAEQANREKSRFLSNMSHELRTPMHAIMGFSNIALKQADNDKMRNYLARINESGERLTSLLNNLIDLSRLEAGKMQLNIQEHNLTSLVIDCISELASMAINRGIRIEFDSSRTFLGTFDKKLLGQVISNVLANAIKFSDDNSHVCLMIRTQTSDEVLAEEPRDSLLIEVRDHGVGIPADEQEKVFDSFMQSSKTMSTSGGTGLGLPIAMEIIKLHKGDISIQSPLLDEDRGTLVTIRIPVNPLSH